MRTLVVASVACVAIIATPCFTQSLVYGAEVDQGRALAQAHSCLNCHQIERKVVGPALADVAERYARDPGAEARLADKIRLGGSGSWGVVPMPANPVTEDEAHRLARWVLAQKSPHVE